MKRLILLAIIFSIVFISPCLFADEVKIPERTVIPVKLIQHIKGDQISIGQNVDLEVSRDIIIDGVAVIKRGAPAYATITSAKKAGYVSQGGKIGLSIDYCKAVDGQKVYLRSILQRESEDHMGANIAASIIVCPLILLARGDEAELPVGTEFKAYVENDVYVEVDASGKSPKPQMEQIEQKETEETEKLEEEKIEEEEKGEQETGTAEG
jgi:hypothetical protein